MTYNHTVLNRYHKAIVFKADTGATVNYIKGQYTIILKDTVPTTTGHRIRLPDNSIIQPTLSRHLPLPMLPSTATQAHAYTNLKSASLLSIGQLCDSNCSSLFTKKDVTVFNSYKHRELNGTRNTSDSLWGVTIGTSQPEPTPTANINQHANFVLQQEKAKS